MPEVPYRFQSLFMFLATMKNGFKEGCRLVIGVDECFLKGMYMGQVMADVGRDTNNNMYPISMIVVEAKTKDNWTWFLEALGADFGPSGPHGWTFISDRQKKKYASHSEVNSDTPLNRPLATDLNASVTDERPSKCPRILPEEIDATSLQRDPGKRPQIWEFPVNLQDEMGRAYLRAGPCQPILKPTEYPVLGPENHRHRFQAFWFQTYSTWLEYSKSKDAIFCHPCYIFAKKSTGRPGSDAFTVKGFKNWKKVNDGMNCPLMGHVGTDPNSPHKIAVKCCEDLKNYSRHIGKGHDESSDSKNKGNFIELIKFLATFNDKVDGDVLTNASRNAKYTSLQIQKEILHIFATKVRDVIRKEIGDAKFCILVDEARDESKREQMAIILRFVDKDALVATSREAKSVHQFFENLNFIINIVVGSSKRNDELQSAQVAEIESMIASNEIETGRGANQIVLDTISKEGTNYSQRGDAEAAYMQNSQDILNAMKLVSTTKSLL
ncbi:uncharacterized protein LOC133853901 [Alnus glutinosa]|uniref:uncharacterized protein LOC133853901 n=1 Tax=Alnus glutinosa TaxID=3517 RepID=UPI002D79EFDC|nr:uncharacterized protein LOC133853901 [Alnus glutinosa]